MITIVLEGKNMKFFWKKTIIFSVFLFVVSVSASSAPVIRTITTSNANGKTIISESFSYDVSGRLVADSIRYFAGDSVVSSQWLILERKDDSSLVRSRFFSSSATGKIICKIVENYYRMVGPNVRDTKEIEHYYDGTIKKTTEFSYNSQYALSSKVETFGNGGRNVKTDYVYSSAGLLMNENMRVNGVLSGGTAYDYVNEKLMHATTIGRDSAIAKRTEYYYDANSMLVWTVFYDGSANKMNSVQNNYDNSDSLIGVKWFGRDSTLLSSTERVFDNSTRLLSAETQMSADGTVQIKTTYSYDSVNRLARKSIGKGGKIEKYITYDYY
jgi:hypothetical protein